MESKRIPLQKEVKGLERQILQRHSQFSSSSTSIGAAGDNETNNDADKETETDQQIYLKLLKNIEKTVMETATEKKQQDQLNSLQQTLDSKRSDEGVLRESFYSFRRTIASQYSNADMDTIVDAESKEAEKIQEIKTARLAFLKTKLGWKREEKKSLEAEESFNGVDELGYEQLHASLEDKKAKNVDREKEILRVKSLQKKYIADLKEEERKLELANQSLEEKAKLVEELDVDIKRKNDLISKRPSHKTKESEVATASRELVELNYFKSEKEIQDIKAEIQTLKKLLKGE